MRLARTVCALAALVLAAGCGSSGRDTTNEAPTTTAAPTTTTAATAAPTTTTTTSTTITTTSTTAARPADTRFRVLVFTRTTGFRHSSIDDGAEAVRRIGAGAGFDVDTTEDPASFTDDSLRRYAVVMFLSTTGDVLDPAGQAAFERFIGRGGGFVGVHSATDTEYDWPFYGRVVGAYFKNHPATQPARIKVEDRAHASTRTLPSPWTRTDEWYDFRANPRPNVHVLLTVDETSYTGGSMGADHPIAWCHAVSGGRSWYTALGHPDEAFADPLLRDHLRGGIQYAAGRAGGCG